MKKLYIFSHTFDEGFDRPDFLYYATSKLEVLQRQLDQMQQNTVEGKKLRQIYSLMSIDRDKWEYDNTISNSENQSNRMLYITTRTPEELLELIDQSYVDGDSEARVSLSEFNLTDIIDI